MANPEDQRRIAATHQVMVEAGITRFRRAAQTPFNLVYKVRA